MKLLESFQGGIGLMHEITENMLSTDDFEKFFSQITAICRVYIV